jgi:hypothetical protein
MNSSSLIVGAAFVAPFVFIVKFVYAKTRLEMFMADHFPDLVITARGPGLSGMAPGRERLAEKADGIEAAVNQWPTSRKEKFELLRERYWRAKTAALGITVLWIAFSSIMILYLK